jgi:hypothetical protein
LPVKNQTKVGPEINEKSEVKLAQKMRSLPMSAKNANGKPENIFNSKSNSPTKVFMGY